ncbi:ATP-binding cassette, subfamily C, CydC [Devosia enhydra]|uniref:ATP-binding cassette, subfamily C, CydC n=1 Tax=Devosia enhydra TaxID=665118 RepID=A0A1K2I2Z0_9HYPH|nr:thiol reductant ABC exporter subunit CydC [Devosia enhydra]SFZ86587.1 ATP-binding cassette, subfamily C, CydC [Devosia enhydra]
MMKALLTFVPLAAPRWRRMALALVLSLITLLAGIALLGVSGWFLTAAFLTTAGAAFNLFVPSALVRGLSFIRILARYGEKLAGHDATLRLLSDLRGWSFAALFPRLPLPGQGLRHGDLVSRLTADIDALDTVFLVAIGPFVTAVLAGGLVIAGMAIFLPEAIWVYLPGYLLAVLGIPALLVLLTQKPGAALVAATASARIGLLDALDGRQDLIAFAALPHARQGFATSVAGLGVARRRIGTWQALSAAAIQGLAGLTTLGVLLLGLERFASQGIDAPVLVGLLLAGLGSFEASAMGVRAVAKLGAASAAAQRLSAMAALRPAVDPPLVPQPRGDDLTLSLDGVWFGHDAERPVLKGATHIFAPGSRTAIIGLSGAGKTTLLHLLLRLCDPDRGDVRLGAIRLCDIAEDALHSAIALLGKDAPIFADTIRDNLRIAAPEADDAALFAALDAARLGDHVRSLPKGLDTLLGESAQTLSSGQARRLALARVLLTNAPILVLDEPTAGLDRETEAQFLADLGAATGGRTVILATHASLPAGAVDTVLSLRDGRLAPFDPRGL